METAAQTLGADDGLAAHIGDRSMLLLFDNFEHLVAAAPEVAALLVRLPEARAARDQPGAAACPGEHESAVPPLARAEAVDLFVARASRGQARLPSTPPFSEICRRLDDLPLALELAAARVKSLTPARSSPGSSSACRCSPAARATCRSASGRCAPRSSGATSC